MRQIFLILFLAISFYAKEISIDKLIDYYKNKEYKKVCLNGLKIYYKLKKSEDLVSMYGISCLKADFIDRLAVPAVSLKQTKTGRKNAIYFLTILLQKKILLSSLFDNFKISDVKLPDTDYILSKIFRMYQQNRYKKEGNKLIFRDPENKDISYKLIIKNEDIPKIELLELKKNHLIKKHIYW